jgi:hypothetical protein
MNSSVVVAREPKTVGTTHVPDFLVTNGSERYLIEVKPSASEGRRAADALASVLDAYDVGEAYVVVPEGEPSGARLVDDRIRIVTPSELGARFSEAV